MKNTPIVAPSILAGNHAHLAESEAVIAEHGLAWVHLDIMDGHFVPNLSFGPQTLKDLRAYSGLYFDTHLMLDNPDKYIDAFIDAGTNSITIHVEPDFPKEATLKKIRKQGAHAGISLKPKTPISAIEPYLELVDIVLVMTVEPGFGGQAFEDAMLPKIEAIDQMRRTRDLTFRIEVDGGIDEHTGPRCKAAGADTFVTGTAFFRAKDKDAFLQAFA